MKTLRVAALALRGAPALSTQADWLAADESARAAAMRSPRRRRQFVAGRWLLHRVAREAFAPAGYRLEVVENRPLVHSNAGTPAACNLSHSGGDAGEVILCAAGQARAVGVDVEQVRPRRYWEALCERVLHPAEWERVRRLEGMERWLRFYEIWVFKEALAKALGIGLGFPFRELAVSREGRIEQAPAAYGLEQPGWHLCPLDAGAGFVAALAWQDA